MQSIVSGRSLTAPKPASLLKASPVCRARVHRSLLTPQALFGGGKDGGLGGMGNLMENIKKAQAMVQVEAAKVQEELAAAEFEGFSSDETVRVVMSGNQEPRAVDITEEAYSQGAEALSALVREAMVDSHGKSVAGMKLRMSKLATSLGIPGQPPSM